MCLLIEYMEYKAWCRKEGLCIASYADFLDTYITDPQQPRYWID